MAEDLEHGDFLINLVEAIDSYQNTVDKWCLKKSCKALNDFITEIVPDSIKSRTPNYITQPELSQIMKWKLLHGKYRPGLQSYIDSLSDSEVQTVSRIAFALKSKNLRESLKTLCKLKGVGPATATLVLSLIDSDIAFMSDEALTLITKSPKSPKYTIDEACELTKQCRILATELNDLESDSRWTANIVQQALWVMR